jgi:hypothetical protein
MALFEFGGILDWFVEIVFWDGTLIFPFCLISFLLHSGGSDGKCSGDQSQ